MKYLILALLMTPLLALADGVPHAQLSSSDTQLGPRVITYDSIDSIHSMSYTPMMGLQIQVSGLYFVLAAPQVVTGKGCYDAWMTVNSRLVANSNVRYCSSHPHQTDVIVSQGVGCYLVNDYINFEQSGPGIEAIQPPGEPLIPSIIFTAFRIGGC